MSYENCFSSKLQTRRKYCIKLASFIDFFLHEFCISALRAQQKAASQENPVFFCQLSHLQILVFFLGHLTFDREYTEN